MALRGGVNCIFINCDRLRLCVYMCGNMWSSVSSACDLSTLEACTTARLAVRLCPGLVCAHRTNF